MARMLEDPQHLRNWVNQFEELLRQKEPGVNRAEIRYTLTEVYFRLALHATTGFSEALQSLMKAFRIDATNPKYVYHIARLYFSYGMFEQAQMWLKTAHKLSPTSHRIWSHIAVLQRELNEQYHTNSEYQPNALLKVSNEIINEVRGGNDGIRKQLIQFVPPKVKKEQSHGGTALSSSPENHPISQADETPNPEREKVPVRLSSPNICRWSGVLDIGVEQLFSHTPNSSNLKRIKPQLVEIAQSAVKRRGGVHAFVTLAIQWIVCGYPIETIDRIRERYLDDFSETPSMQLLNIVSNLYVTPLHELPQQIATALHQRHLPPLLAASIHQRRILWSFSSLQSYNTFQDKVLNNVPMSLTEAQAFLKTNADVVFSMLSPDEQSRLQTAASMLTTRLTRNDVLSLFSPSPQPVITDDADDDVAEAIDPSRIGEWFGKFTTAIATITDLQRNLFDYLRQKIEPLAESPLAAPDLLEKMADFQVLEALVARFPNLSKDADEALSKNHAAIEKLGPAQAPTNYADRREICKNQITELGKIKPFIKPQNRVRKTFEALPEFTQNNTAPSDILAAFGRQMDEVSTFIREYLKSDTSATRTSTEDGVTPEQDFEALVQALSTERPSVDKWLQPLQDAVYTLDERIEAMFTYILGSFAPYRQSSDATTFIYLRCMVEYAYAELMYRLDKKPLARQKWNAILLGDRLNIAVAKNIAIVDTMMFHVRDALSSWQNYAETIYLYAILADAPSLFAKERAEFHQAYANGFAPKALTMATEEIFNQQETLDPVAIAEFLSNRAAVRTFMNHTLLAFFNQKLDFKSPLSILGRSRSEGASEATRKKLLDYNDMVAALMPEHVREAFHLACQKFFEKAHETAQKANRMTAKADIYYKDEEQRRSQWVNDIFELKARFFALANVPKICAYLTSVSFLDEMLVLDRIPMDFSETDITNVSKSSTQLRFQLWSRYNHGVDFINTVRNIFVNSLFDFIYAPKINDDKHMEALRQRQYERLLTQWVHTETMQPFKQFINRGFVNSFLDGIPEQEYLPTLIQIIERFPGVTGPAIMASTLLVNQNKPDDAFRVIDDAIKRARVDEFALQARIQRIGIRLSMLSDRMKQEQQKTVFTEVVSDGRIVLNSDTLEGVEQHQNIYTQIVMSMLQINNQDEAFEILSRHFMQQTEPSVRVIIVNLRIRVILHCRSQNLKVKSKNWDFYKEMLVSDARYVLENTNNAELRGQAQQIVDALG